MFFFFGLMSKWLTKSPKETKLFKLGRFSKPFGFFLVLSIKINEITFFRKQ